MISWMKTETRAETRTVDRQVECKARLLVETSADGMRHVKEAGNHDIIEAIKADNELRWLVRAELDGQPHIDWRSTEEDNIKRAKHAEADYIEAGVMCDQAQAAAKVSNGRAEKAEAALATAEKERATAIALCTESVRKSNKELGCALAEVEALKMERDEARQAGKEVCRELDAARAEIERLKAECAALIERGDWVKKELASDALELRARRALDEWITIAPNHVEAARKLGLI